MTGMHGNVLIYDRCVSLRDLLSRVHSGKHEIVNNASHNVLTMKSLAVVVVTIVSLELLKLSLLWRRLYISARNSPGEGRQGHGTEDLWDVIGGQLAVVVPIGVGEGARAMEAMKRWPRVCSEITLNKVDLFLYYSEKLTGQDELHIPEEASKCFKSTKAITANIAHEVYAADSLVAQTEYGDVLFGPDSDGGVRRKNNKWPPLQ